MPREIESMSDHELLAELVRQGRSTRRENRIRTCLIALLLLAIIGLALFYIPKIMEPIRRLDACMEQVESTMQEAQRFFDSFDADTVEKFEQAMDNFNETSQQTRDFMQRFKDSGLDRLESTLEDFNAALQSFLQFFGRR